MSSPSLTRFKNCRLLRDHQLIELDLWVREGRIVDPEKVFFDEHRLADDTVDCGGAIVAPGFIDLQINGGFGYDFSNIVENVEQGVGVVAEKILAHGVTSFCPTVITSLPATYHAVLPHIPKRSGGSHGATVLGVHVEGPFINVDKKGAHPQTSICDLDAGFETLLGVYGSLDNVRIVTLAPEKPQALATIERLTQLGITAAVGHSMANLVEGEAAVRKGSNLITHLFNAMLPFHHRDPGLVGLLTSDAIPADRTVYFGIIADGCHTHPAALRIAHRAHPLGLILVTDAISALGLSDGIHYLGELEIEVRDGRGFIARTETICGSIASLDECVRIFMQSTGCSVEYALEAASLHPAQCLNISPQKGTLDFGADADLVMLSDDLTVLSTWIAGQCVYQKHISRPMCLS